jgi:hypothetical protein
MTTLRTYRVTVATADGQPLFTVVVGREPIDGAKPAPGPVPAPADGHSHDGSAAGEDADTRMTEPQKRYLFRLLAQQGVAGKAAEAHLKQAFQVSTLREISKAAASQRIDEMLADQKEANHAHA